MQNNTESFSVQKVVNRIFPFHSRSFTFGILKYKKDAYLNIAMHVSRKLFMRARKLVNIVIRIFTGQSLLALR